MNWTCIPISGESLIDMSTHPLNKKFLSYSNYGVIYLEIFNFDWNLKWFSNSKVLFMIDKVFYLWNYGGYIMIEGIESLP